MACWRAAFMAVFLAGSWNRPRWRPPPRQPNCLARDSDLQRRSRPQVVEDELRRCCSTQVHTAARTPHPPTTQPSHDARAFGTDRARAAPPQEPAREPMGSCSTPTRRSVAQPRLHSSRSELAQPAHAAENGSIAAPQHDTAVGRARVLSSA